MPGFTAETSVSGAIIQYYVHSMYSQAEQRVYLADYIDQNCLGTCKKNCTIVCAGETAQAKTLCFKLCARENAQCETTCKRPGNPPGTSCPSGLTLCGGV